MIAQTNLIYALDKMGPREQSETITIEIATLGSRWMGPMGEGQLPLNTRIATTCHRITGEGARPVLVRATDKRLDCPYNGAGALA